MGILKDYFHNSSLHGFHFIADGRFHWTERLFWTLCVAASWGASLALMLSALEQYQSQKISFSVDTSYLEWKTNFPAIVICEKSNVNKMDEANKKFFGSTSTYFPQLETFVYYDGTIRKEERCKIDGDLRDKCLLGNYSHYMRQLRSKCSEVIESCYYNEQEFSCCDEFLPIETYHGPCFGFNTLLSGKYKSSTQLPFKVVHSTDHGYGNLSIRLVNSKFYVYGLSQDAVPTKDSSGKYLLIDSDTSTGIASGSYYKAFLSVIETLTEEDSRLMSIENRGCRFYDENNLQHSEIYSTSACENDCLAEAQRKSCNCIVHTLPHNDQVKDCDFEGLLCTMNNAEINQNSKSCSCISSCFDVELNIIGHTKTLLQDKQDENAIRVDFCVQPPTLRYTRTVVKTPLSMLVSVGGTVGLFVGASLLTIVEIIYYFVIRPLGTKYLNTKKNNFVKKSKHLDYTDRHYFEYVN